MVFLMSVSIREGLEPIVENLSVIILSRLRSLSISLLINPLSTFFFDFKYSFHPIKEERGVPSWCAVSFARPVHNLSLSDLFE